MTLAAANYPLNCGLATSSFARTFAKRQVDERAFDIQATPVNRVTQSSGSTTVQQDDQVLRQDTGATVVTDFSCTIIPRGAGQSPEVTVISSDTDVIESPATSGPSAGIAVFQGVGSASLRAISDQGEVQIARVATTQTGGQTAQTFLNWDEESLAGHCTTQLEGRLSGDVDLYTGPLTRNPAAWLADVDLSCVSRWNSTGGNQRAGTLISPRHVLFCAHADFYPAVGATMQFVSPSGVVREATLSARIEHPQYVDFLPGGWGVPYRDVAIGLLEWAGSQPDDISFAKVLPASWEDYLPTLADTSTTLSRTERNIPVVRLSQFGRAHVADWNYTTWSISNNPVYAWFAVKPNDAVRQPYHAPTIVGDSGQPAFVLMNGEPILLGVATAGRDSVLGTMLANFIDSINEMMTTLGGGYQLTTVDLSEFPTY